MLMLFNDTFRILNESMVRLDHVHRQIKENELDFAQVVESIECRAMFDYAME